MMESIGQIMFSRFIHAPPYRRNFINEKVIFVNIIISALQAQVNKVIQEDVVTVIESVGG